MVWVLIWSVSLTEGTSNVNHVFLEKQEKYLGPHVQSIISLTSSLVVKMLTVLVSKMSNNSQVFLLKTYECKSYSYFFSKNIRVYAIFNDQSLNDTLTNNMVNLEQLGPLF